MGQHNAGPMNYLQLDFHISGTVASRWTTHEHATVDLGSHDNRECTPDPLDVPSRPRIRKRTTGLAPRPNWSPTRARARKTLRHGILRSPHSQPPTQQPWTERAG